MYVIPPHDRRVYLVATRGVVRTFESAVEAIRALGAKAVRRLIGHAVRSGLAEEDRCYWDRAGYLWYTHALLGEDGAILEESDFPTLPPRPIMRLEFGEYGIRQRGRKYGHYRSYRRPRTYQEMRLNTRVLDDGEPPARAARQPANLPDAWDDYKRNDARDINWKRSRKHQYRQPRGPY